MAAGRLKLKTGSARLKSRTARSLKEVGSQLSSAGPAEAVPVLTSGPERHQGPGLGC
jgi:hypothetical protein